MSESAEKSDELEPSQVPNGSTDDAAGVSENNNEGGNNIDEKTEPEDADDKKVDEGEGEPSADINADQISSEQANVNSQEDNEKTESDIKAKTDDSSNSEAPAVQDENMESESTPAENSEETVQQELANNVSNSEKVEEDESQIKTLDDDTKMEEQAENNITGEKNNSKDDDKKEDDSEDTTTKGEHQVDEPNTADVHKEPENEDGDSEPNVKEDDKADSSVKEDKGDSSVKEDEMDSSVKEDKADSSEKEESKDQESTNASQEDQPKVAEQDSESQNIELQSEDQAEQSKEIDPDEHSKKEETEDDDPEKQKSETDPKTTEKDEDGDKQKDEDTVVSEKQVDVDEENDINEESKTEDKPDEEESSDKKEDGDSNDATEPPVVNSSDQEGEESKEPEFNYNYDDYASTSHVTNDSGIPSNLLQVFHSFGYDCKKRSNLFLLPGPTALFAAGNLIHLLNLSDGTHRYLRSAGGGGIGAVTVHPSQEYFAIAEKGTKPDILIFEFPSLKLYRILKEGTEKAYSFIDFNPKGNLLASVGCSPDFMLTVWDWTKENVMLRSKAFSQDIFRVKFAPEQEGQLTSSGTGHIRFWKMARTFTGLKLKGELGRFGKTALTDIDGFVQLPDGKVLSGAEWGNLLLWDGGLIKVEICRKGNKPCHVGSIQQLVIDEGELITIGDDGYVRVWEMESIDNADTTDESDVFEVEPMNELKVGHDTKLSSMMKLRDPNQKEEADDSIASIWYAQDASGGIWKLDLSFSHTTKPPEKLYSFTAGLITGLAASPNSEMFAVTGDPYIRIYDYLTKEALCEYRCPMSASSTSVLWPGKLTFENCDTLLAGFSNGLLRALSIQKIDGGNTISLKQVLKPHTSDVTALALHHDGKILATGSKDSSVFFFRINSTIEPIGFVSVPGPVSYLQWSPVTFTTSTLLVSCLNGKVIQLEAPLSGGYDTSHSFKLNLPIKYYTFQSVKSQLRRDEARERKRVVKEQKLKEKQKELKRRKDRGEEFTEEEEKDFLKEEEDEEEEEPLFFPSSPSPLYSAYYTEENKFVVSVGDYDAGYLYECQFSSDALISQNPDAPPAPPVNSVGVPDSDDVPVTYMYHSPHASSLLVGFANGKLRAYPLPEEVNTGNFKINAITLPYWQMSMHDCEHGFVSSIVESHDGAYLFTGGNDGNIYGYNFLPYEQVYSAMEGRRARLLSARKEDVISTDDIDDPNTYSIEDAKLKAEHDRYMKEVEARKAEERHKLLGLRKKFQELLKRNNELPEAVRLDRSEFELDPTLRINMHEATNKRIERLRLEMQWDQEKLALATRKIRNRFSAMIDCPRIVLHAIQTTHTVASYRINSLGDEYHALEKQMNERTIAAGIDDGSAKERTLSESADIARKESMRDELEQQTSFLQGALKKQKGTTLQGRQAEKVAKAIKKAEEAKKKREKRQKEWEDLYKSKPADNYEDPADIAAIQAAKANIGDFKLKTASDYVVPEHLRMDTEKKKSQILVLQGLIHQEKTNYNKRFRSLREDKIKRIEQITQWVNEIRNIQSKLKKDQIKKVPKIPKMKPDELPEKKYEYTQETLLEFKAAQKERELADASKKRSGEALGSFGGYQESKEEVEEEDDAASSQGSRSTVPGDSPSGSRPSSRSTSNLSPLQLQIQKRNELLMIYRRDQLLRFIKESIVEFDATFHLLRHDKTFLDVDLKMADLRQITLLEEFLILKEYEKRETLLSGRVMSKKNELNDMNAKVTEMQAKLDVKKKDIEKLMEREKALYATLVSLIGENNKFADFLNKVFRKKIKRTRKKSTDEGDDDESEMTSEDESDFSSDDEDDDSIEGGLDDSVCPAGCDEQTFDDVIALREKRLDLEEALMEERKLAEQQKKDIDSMTKKSKVMESQLKTAKDALEEFQVEKQGKLNELEVVVPLRLSQVEHISNGAVPADLSSCLVFTNQSLLGLQRRIKELQHEKAEQRSFFKNARMQHVHLIKDRKVMESKTELLEAKCEQMMLLKFGRIVDLDKLDSITVNKTVEELKQKVHQGEVRNAAKLRKLDERIAGLKETITDMTRENTRHLEMYNVLAREKTSLEQSLDNRQKGLKLDQKSDKRSDIRERQRLMQLVQLQAQEIQALKEEIGLLSRKGGHILPPAQPPIAREEAL